MSETAPELDERRALMAAAFVHIPFDGWSLAAMKTAEQNLQWPAGTARRLFPGGPSEMLAFASAEADRRTEEALADEDLAALKIHQRLALAVRLRLEEDFPRREAAVRAIAFLSLPGHQALAAKCLYETVDAIWRGIGDTSTDFNFYSKRALLAGVLSSTLLYWLQDETEDNADTWAFLERRIDNVLTFHRTRARLERLVGRLPVVGKMFA